MQNSGSEQSAKEKAHGEKREDLSVVSGQPARPTWAALGAEYQALTRPRVTPALVVLLLLALLLLG